MLSGFYRIVRRQLGGWLCLLPLVIYLGLLALAPILRAARLSLQPEGPAASGWTLVHFRNLFNQAAFRAAAGNTVAIALLSLLLEVGLGLILALALSDPSRSARRLRAIFILPMTIPTAVVGVMMTYIFATSGWLNRILMDLGMLHEPVVWVAGGWTSRLMIVAADCWKVTPLVMLILVAGLQAIDRDLYQAARMDGANSWIIFRRITLPLLAPSLTAAIIIRGIDAFRIFDLPLVLMGQNLRVIGTYAYLEYVAYNNPHLSAAAAMVLVAIILAAVTLYLRLVGRKGLG